MVGDGLVLVGVGIGLDDLALEVASLEFGDAAGGLA